MSATNVAIVASVYENFAKGDIPAVLAVLDPEIEWVENSQQFVPWHGTHHGPDAVVSGVFMAVMANFDEFAVVPERFHDAGDTVVVEGRAVAVTKTGNRLASGLGMDRPGWQSGRQPQLPRHRRPPSGTRLIRPDRSDPSQASPGRRRPSIEGGFVPTTLPRLAELGYGLHIVFSNAFSIEKGRTMPAFGGCR